MFDAKTIRLAESLRPDLDFSVLGTEEFAILKIVENARGGGVVPVYDADIINGIASFSGVTKSKPLVSLLLNIPVTQTGSGTPAPDNKRDFIGVSGVNIGQTSGYGKYFRGLLNGTYGFVDLSDLSWLYRDTYEIFYSGVNRDVKIGTPNCICSGYLFNPDAISTSVSSISRLLNDKEITTFENENNQGRFAIKDTNYTDIASFKAAISGMKLIYELAEPSTPVTPQEFAMLCQAFGITGNTYQITFGQTVYSAILDVLTGKLYLIDEIKTIDENSNISMLSTATGVFFDVDPFFDIEEDTDSVDCNIYQRGTNRATTQAVLNNNPDYSFCCRLSSSTTRIMIKDTRYTSVEDYKAWLTNNPVKIAVKLAEPIEIQLTPTEILTLIGENVIFADVADVTECKYTRK